MPRVRSRNAYQHVPGFDKGRIVAYRNFGLSYHSIAARVGGDPMTVSRIWNRWFQDGKKKFRAGYQRLPFIISREDRHVIRMALMDREATSGALRIRVVYKKTSVCANSLTTFAAT
ncbi:HTH_Tnp_Tc3_2 domain-containing protein [Trichonephila clavipes]|nr:HTH_Tnp_Tc3_2 domain-containing protein [Trichonephila clavipes]